ncbi:Aflatoxin B1 aldehyde reductase member 2 [Mortierella alpina]|uniref:Aflatoxin B1 aldehyde reductase member 2 n=1 Tax=Mortierella alpina TaxID=64518 RepID=A0A9P6IRL0_MORAP|nr:Aflatoxin B1 aldehyde reductase member 2 [Mortierella alpina]
MTLSTSLPRIILGAMTFGLESTDPASTACRVFGSKNVGPLLEMFHSYGHVEIDSARLYCGGDTEQVLGQLPLGDFKVATKVFPFSAGAHEAANLERGIRDALTALKSSKVDIFYLHAPDRSTPFERTLEAVNDLYNKGLFERFGLSNFAAWEVAEICEICKHHGYVLPTVYQGSYNPIGRSIVPELFPCLKRYGMAFYAYSPLGAGLLSGKYSFEEEVIEGSRLDPKTAFGNYFRGRFWNKRNMEAVQLLVKAAQANKMTLVEASWRWMRHHSGLGEKDGIVIGASSLKQLENNLLDLEKGSLPQAMIDALDDAWLHVAATTTHYTVV